MARGVEVGEPWVLLDQDGKHLSRHLTYGDAFAQLRDNPDAVKVNYLPER